MKRDSSLSIEDIISSPFTLLGTPGEMIEKIVANRKRFGISYWVVKTPAIVAMKHVVAELANH